ncbi:MAG: hypothetical protein GY928_40440 [Colwellia sp.]|nr:hypothetical protein [Colwellia sp.]
MKRIYLISLFALTIFILIGYWIKCQTSTNFSESISLSNLTPFKYLQRNDVISVPEPGIILYDSFEKRPIISNWSELWMRDEGKVTKDYDSHGIKNSLCLLVQSNSSKSWAYSHNKYVEVLEGDIFSFEGLANLQGDKISAYAGIAAFDKQKNPIKWNYLSEKVDKTKKWIKVKNRFVVPNGINYIKFRLSGVGIGKFKFDNICLRKEVD